MDRRFFEHPILNSPYEYPARHWELDASGQPTDRVLEHRRRVSFITPIPKPKKQKAAQPELVFDAGARCSRRPAASSTTSPSSSAASGSVYWVPGVNNLGAYGRWAFAELTDVYEMEEDLEAALKARFQAAVEQAVR